MSLKQLVSGPDLTLPRPVFKTLFPFRIQLQQVLFRSDFAIVIPSHGNGEGRNLHHPLQPHLVEHGITMFTPLTEQATIYTLTVFPMKEQLHPRPAYPMRQTLEDTMMVQGAMNFSRAISMKQGIPLLPGQPNGSRLSSTIRTIRL